MGRQPLVVAVELVVMLADTLRDRVASRWTMCRARMFDEKTEARMLVRAVRLFAIRLPRLRQGQDISVTASVAPPTRRTEGRE